MRFSLLFRVLTTLLATLGAVACETTTPPPEATLTACEDPRPQVCTTIYAPVCAVHEDGHRETHASACNACANDTVTAHEPGPCDEGAAP